MLMKSFTYSTVVLSHVIAINFLYSSFLQHLHQARQRFHLKQPQLLTWNLTNPSTEQLILITFLIILNGMKRLDVGKVTKNKLALEQPDSYELF